LNSGPVARRFGDPAVFGIDPRAHQRQQVLADAIGFLEVWHAQDKRKLSMPAAE
jgi:hypothetical protein